MDSTDLSEQNATLDRTADKLADLNRLAGRLGTSLTRAFASGVTQGKSFDDILGRVGKSLIDIGLRAAVRPLASGLSSAFSQMFSGVGSLFSGGGAPSVPVTPFADGGIISAPGYFPLGPGLGLAGESGPEAILPLSRGSDGRLGVAAGGGRATNVTVNIQTPDVEGFARSQAQIAAAIARATARGHRNL